MAELRFRFDLDREKFFNAFPADGRDEDQVIQSYIDALEPHDLVLINEGQIEFASNLSWSAHEAS